MGELPKCPLCGSEPKREGPTMICGGKNGYCAIEPENEHAGPVFTIDEWMRLAAPPLPPEVVAVLRAADAIAIAAGRTHFGPGSTQHHRFETRVAGIAEIATEPPKETP